MANEMFKRTIDRNPEDTLYRGFEITPEAGAAGSMADGTYGPYKLSTADVKSLQESDEFSSFREKFQGLEPGSEEFNKAWQSAGEEFPDQFTWAQYDFVDRTKNMAQKDLVEEKYGLKIEDRPESVRNVFFAGALEYPADSSAMGDALKSTAADRKLDSVAELTDEDVMKSIIDLRSAEKSPEVQKALGDELKAAETLLQEERKLKEEQKLNGGLGVPVDVSATYAKEHGAADNITPHDSIQKPPAVDTVPVWEPASGF